MSVTAGGGKSSVRLEKVQDLQIPSPMEMSSLVSSQLPKGVIANAFFSSAEARSILMPRGDDWILVAANQKWMDTFGRMKVDEPVQIPPEQIDEPVQVPPEQKDEIEGLRRRVLEEGKVISYGRKRKDAEGEELDVSVVLEPALDENGTRVGVIRRTKDITADLARQEAERKAQTAENLNAILNNFIGDALNNLVAGISSSIDLGLMEVKDGDIADAIETFTSSQEAADRLIKGVRTFQSYSSLNEGRLKSGPVDVKPVINRLLEGEYNPYNDEPVVMPRNLRIEYTSREGGIPLDELPKVNGPPDIVQTAISETVINAVESEISKKDLNVTISAREEEGNLVLTVSDNGRGLSPGELEKSQLPFYKVAATKPSGRLGLGSFIASESAKFCGGGIKIESEKNKGTTATITLPLAK